MSAKKGYYLVVEGGDGCGKSTQVQMLAEHFRAQDRRVIVVNEPGGTSFGERLRTLFKDTVMVTKPLTQLYMIMAAKHDLMCNVIKPALERGDIVISDRGMMSLYVYQGLLGGIPRVDLERPITYGAGWCEWLIHPDDEIFLSCNYLEAYRRSSKRGAPTDFDPTSVGAAQTMAQHYEDIFHHMHLERYVNSRPSTTMHHVDTTEMRPDDVHLALRRIVERTAVNTDSDTSERVEA